MQIANQPIRLQRLCILAHSAQVQSELRLEGTEVALNVDNKTKFFLLKLFFFLNMR